MVLQVYVRVDELGELVSDVARHTEWHLRGQNDRQGEVLREVPHVALEQAHLALLPWLWLHVDAADIEPDDIRLRPLLLASRVDCLMFPHVVLMFVEQRLLQAEREDVGIFLAPEILGNRNRL